jgi:hypothetical protein
MSITLVEALVGFTRELTHLGTAFSADSFVGLFGGCDSARVAFD